VLTRHDDICAVLADHERFSSAEGIRLGSDPAAVAEVSGRMLLVSDVPRHTVLKKAFAPLFSGRALESLVHQVHDLAATLVGRALRRRECDFAVEVATVLPSRVVADIFGAPVEAAADIARLTDEALGSDDPADQAEAHAELFLFSSDLLEESLRRKRSPADAALASAVEILGFEDVLVNVHGVLLAANETTRYAAAGALDVLIRQAPGDVPAVMAGWDLSLAVEEVLRWTCPGMHVLRTATAHTLIRDTEIRAGEQVTVWLASANLDERVFARPEVFDPHRDPNPHLTFGFGRHRCLGERLARIELVALLSELRRQVRAARHLTPPVPRRSNHLRGLERMPVVLTAGAG
jgi:cytochrome P450